MNLNDLNPAPKKRSITKSQVAGTVIFFLASVFIGFWYANEIGYYLVLGAESVGVVDPNAEPEGCYSNGTKGPDFDVWSVAIYNGLAPERAWPLSRMAPDQDPACGEVFREYSQKHFTHRINASTPESATKLLREYTAYAKTMGKKVVVIAVVEHGAVGTQTIGRKRLGPDFLLAVSEARDSVALRQLLFCGCSVARGELGHEYLRLVAALYHIDVLARDATVSFYKGDIVGSGTLWGASPSGVFVKEPFVPGVLGNI